MQATGEARGGNDSSPGSAKRPPEAGAARDGDAIERQVRAEQVRTLFRQSAPVLLANVFNAAILSLVLWSRVHHGLLLGWTAAMALVSVARIAMRQRYWSKDWTAPEQEAWGARFTISSLCSGSLWGFAGAVLPPASLPHQVVVVFVVGGMAAGAAGTLSCFMRAYYAFLLPSVLPAGVRLLIFGDEAHLAMAAMLVLYMLALTLVARNVNMALAQAFRLRFENATLLEQVSDAQASLVRANEGLSRANELLERRVQERTAELKESQQELAEIVRESPDGILVLDGDGTVVSVNPGMLRISGLDADAVEGHHFAETEALTGIEAARAVDAFRATLLGEHRPPDVFQIKRVDGTEAIIEVNPRLVVGADGKRRVHAVVRDVTERNRAQRLKDEYEGRLRQAQRLESVGMLAGGVAHDFNNLLTMMLGNLDALADDVFRPQKNDLLEEIRHGALQAADLTKQLLAFSRQQVLDVKPTNIGRLLKYSRQIFERATGERIVLSISWPEESPVVLVDATQLEQALINLLVNARHAMPDGGTVAIRVDRIDVQQDPDWPDAAPGPYVLIAVSDTGSGMDEATRARVFDPFFTTKELGHGTGLGLSTVHGIVTQAGGHIRVVSSPGAGSRFEILLPSHAAPAEAEAEAGSPRPSAPSAGGKTVLVVEDQPQVQRSVRRILRAAGYEVLCAENGEQALEMAEAHSGLIDLLVTDVIMPGLSGVELSRRLMTTYPALGVLLVSGYTGNEITQLAELGAGVQFLQKPFDAAKLTASASAALEASRRIRRAKPE